MRKLNYFVFSFILIIFLSGCNVNKRIAQHNFSLGSSDFLLNGKPFRMISGEMHYTRIPREYWRDRMRMAKAMGLNTIGTYVFWNAHEPKRGEYDFSGDNDIAAFIATAKEEGLWVVLRPSPYVCAEWEFGGYPWWLLKDSTIKVRSMDKRFVDAYTQYINELAKHLTPLLVTRGGNILMVQVENEYGSYSNDKLYMELNRKIFSEAGFDCILFTCDGADKMANGYLPGYLPAVNGLDDTAEVKKLINKYHSGKGPYYIAEWYPGWFDQWGKPHANIPSEKNAETLDKVLNAGISINMYMFHGGSTRGFMNGANMNINEPYAPQVSSYDYDGPLDEAGNATEKFYKFREVIARHLPDGTTLPPVPEKKKTIVIDPVPLTEYAGVMDNLPQAVISKHPISFEELDQAYGFVLYQSAIGSPGTGWLKINGLRDYALVYVDGRRVAILDRRTETDSVLLNNVPAKARIEIWTENNGRVNYGPYLTDNRKGILGAVTFKGHPVDNWSMYGLPFNDLHTLKFQPNTGKADSIYPACYRGEFSLKETGDTYFDMRSFGKGIVFLNGHHLGKYWKIGPQQTLYVPGCWLKKGTNEVVVFDAIKKGHTQLTTLPYSILNQQAVIND